MTGASKKRGKAERQQKLQASHNDGHSKGNHPHVYDGPSERPGSSAGPGQASGSRGRAPSNVPPSPSRSNQPSVQAPSVRSSSRPGSAAGPPSAAGQPLRDPARDPAPTSARAQAPAGNTRIDWGGAAFFNYGSEDVMPTELMKRPGYGKLGDKIRLKLNSHYVEKSQGQKGIFYQYDVQIGSGLEKRGLIKTVWESNQLEQKLPGGRNDWLFDGNKLAWSSRNIQQELRLTIDLDAERGRPASENKAPDHVRVVIRGASTGAKIDLNNIYEYMDGRCAWGAHVIDAINFLDHLIREWPSKQHTNIKRSYFSRESGEKFALGGGIEAMRGVYQSIRMAEGKRLVINVDVSHATFWQVSSFNSIINQLTGHRDVESLQMAWRDNNGRPNFKFDAMKRLKANWFTVKHNGQSAEAAKKEWRVHAIMPKSAHEHKFAPWNKARNAPDPEITIFQHYQKTFNIRLNYPHLPLVQTAKTIIKRDAAGNILSKSNIVFPMELCLMKSNQRYPYKMNEQQTAMMIKFAVQKPPGRLAGINKGLDMLAWEKDPYLKHYGLKLSREQIQTNARVLPPPKLQFAGSVTEPGTSGRWDLKGKKFVAPNKAPLVSWGVMIVKATSHSSRGIQMPQAQAFVKSFVDSYRGHGGQISNTQPLIQEQAHGDLAKAVEMLLTAVGNKHNMRPQMFMFILPDKNADVYLRIKKSCDCRWGIYSQCVQSAHALKCAPQYISNVLMKFNAKLGGTTNRIVTQGSGHFPKPTMIIGADVSHSAPGIHAPSYAAMTVSMDRTATRYAAGVQTNGFRVEMISTRNLRDCLMPLFRNWMTDVSGGRLPDHVYYFRDGVSEGQFKNVLKTEVADLKQIFKELGETRPEHDVKFTVIVAEKRHHIRFFPQGKGADKNGNPLPGTIVDHDITDPRGNDVYLCSHSAIQGTARPTHYTMLMDDANVPVDLFQKLLYEQCYQYIRSTTPVSLHPAVYYAHLASNRARSHENISETERRVRDHQEPSGSTSERPPEEAAPLLAMNPADRIQFGMWYV